MCFIPSFVCVSGVVYNTERGEGRLISESPVGNYRLKLTNRTHTDERKMIQLSYFVPGCVISMLILIVFINRCTLEWSGEY